MTDSVQVQCPWCHEWQWLWLAVDDLGEMVQDCEVCCRPWVVLVAQNPDGTLRASVQRS